MKSDIRRTKALTGSTLALLASLPLGLLLANGSGPSLPTRAENKYIGADKCKSCHGSPDSGDQYSVWKGEKHAKAFESLASEAAKKIAKGKGIDDPQKSAVCSSCHVTAFGVAEDKLKKGFDPRQGVQCESCHGPGEQHVKARFAAAAKGDPAQAYVQIPADEIIASPRQGTCLQCHNEASPNFKPFCFQESLAKIRHLNPKKPRAEGELLVCGCKAPCPCSRGSIDGCGVPGSK